MTKRFLTVQETLDFRLQLFDESVYQVREILSDMNYLNPTTEEYRLAMAMITETAEEIWKLKDVAVEVNE